MHDIIERFVGRYRVWRAQRTQNNPLDFPAMIAGIGLAQITYDVIVRHHLTWWIGFVTALDVAFLALYFRRSPWAWFILPVWGVMILVAFSPVFTLRARYPLQIVVLSAVFALTLGIGLVAWGYAIRRRYYSYIGYRL
jgi:predicted RND superfamily exporter protein